jgi:hypothetical protein
MKPHAYATHAIGCAKLCTVRLKIEKNNKMRKENILQQ